MKEIETLNNYVNKYYNSSRQDGNELNELLQKFRCFISSYIKAELQRIQIMVFDLVKQNIALQGQ
jgi:hypothetical protein